MKKRACTRCRVVKPLADFFKRAANRTDGHQYACRACFSKRAAELYRANPEKYNKQKNAYTRGVRAAVDALKNAPCVDCKKRFPPYVMDFDHRDGTIKTGAVSRLRSISLKMALAEIEKCDLVCANCHRIRTYKRGQWGRKRSARHPPSGRS